MPQFLRDFVEGFKMIKKTTTRDIIVLMLFITSVFTVYSLTSFSSADLSKKTETNQAMPVIHFSTGLQNTNTLANMIADFNANYSPSYGFKVQLDENKNSSSNAQHDYYLANFTANSSTLDVIAMDVIWPAEFASEGYILPLDDVFNASYQNQFLQAQIEAGTINGHIYGVPWFHDSGMLYYRSDIINYSFSQGIIPANRPPQTWDELSNWTHDMMANQTLVNKFNLTSGFVWQGKSYEGLMCDFMEYIGATGTYSFLNADQSAPIFNSSSGISNALQYMKSLITTYASPQTVLTYDEGLSTNVWNKGNAIFMRNWPYAYSLSLNSVYLNGTYDGTNKQQFNVTTMPAQNETLLNNGLARTSCLGGWQLGVNAYSKYPAQAKKFIMWLTSAKEQIQYFLGEGVTPTLKPLYNDPAIVNSPQGFVHSFLPIFESALPRPVSPLYAQMSANITSALHSYLEGSITLNNATSKMQTKVQTIINQNAINIPSSSSSTTSTTSSTSSTSSKPTLTTTPGFEFLSILAVLTMTSCLLVYRKRIKL